MPEYGSNTEDAIATAISLAENGGYQEADLMLITDGISMSAHGDIQAQITARDGLRLFILGVGTDEGAPIPTANGGFVKDNNGTILVPKLDSSSLQKLAYTCNGYYQTLTSDDSDINTLFSAAKQLFTKANKAQDRTFDTWLDEGFWLIILLIPLLILSFRKGVVFIVVLVPITLTPPAAEALIVAKIYGIHLISRVKMPCKMVMPRVQKHFLKINNGKPVPPTKARIMKQLLLSLNKVIVPMHSII